MSLTQDQFLADVAAVYTGDATNGAFGSGRLIAPGLILTAGHVVDYPTRDSPRRAGWKVCLLRNRNPDGSWSASAHDANLVWRGLDDLDLGLLQLSEETQLKPKLNPVFASLKWVEPIPEVGAAGFPNAWFTAGGTLRDYTVSGHLRIASQFGPFVWSLQSADKPDDRHGWKGMSGAAVCRVGPDEKLYLFGTVQQVPANFSGQLEVARLSKGFDDAEFCAHLQTALGAAPSIVPFPFESHRDNIDRDLNIHVIANTFVQRFASDITVQIGQAYITPQKESDTLPRATDEHPVFLAARQKAETIFNGGRPDDASRAFMDAFEQQNRLCIRLLEEAVFYDKSAKNSDAAFAKLRLIAEHRHHGDRKAQTNYLLSCASEYQEQGTLKGDNAALLLAIAIFRGLAKDKNDVE